MKPPAVEPSAATVDDHRFEAPEGRPWDRCRRCGLGQAAHLDGGDPYEPGTMPRAMWTPEVGDSVWINRADFDEPEGRVVGFVPEGEKRAGQPIIERQADFTPGGPFSRGWKKGERVVIAPLFLLPFPYGGLEWRKANDDGRVV